MNNNQEKWTYGLSQKTIKKIILIFQAFKEIDAVILYGSRAKGNFKPGSDIDMVLKGKKLNLHLLNKISLALDDLLLPYIFDVSIYHQISNPDLIAHIARVGKTFYTREIINGGNQV